jgi:hypothetical protein
MKCQNIGLSILFGSFLLISGGVRADCVCRCVDGQVKAICQNAIDLKPICAPQVCQIVPPSVKPIQSPTVPPVGTKSCSQQQVFNPASGKYEWKSICR